MSSPKFTFFQFQKRFPDEETALEYIFSRRFGHLNHCPDCATETKFHRIKKRKVYSCQHCGYQVSPCAGTIFHKTKTPLVSWLYVIFLITTSRNGVSAKEVQRQIGVTYKTAWAMCHKIRTAMDESNDIFMTGTVEVDESLFSGRHPWAKPNTNPPRRDRHPKKKRGWGADKQCVFGMVERDEKDEDGKLLIPGKIKTMTVPNRKAKTLLPIIVDAVSENATVYSDEFKGYNKLGREVAVHESVCHSDYEWTRGNVHTQGIEGHWSLRKRSIRGTHTSISRKYMQNYLNEFDFRHNHKNENMFDIVLENATPPVDWEPLDPSS